MIRHETKRFLQQPTVGVRRNRLRSRLGLLALAIASAAGCQTPGADLIAGPTDDWFNMAFHSPEQLLQERANAFIENSVNSGVQVDALIQEARVSVSQDTGSEDAVLQDVGSQAAGSQAPVAQAPVAQAPVAQAPQTGSIVKSVSQKKLIAPVKISDRILQVDPSTTPSMSPTDGRDLDLDNFFRPHAKVTPAADSFSQPFSEPFIEPPGESTAVDFAAPLYPASIESVRLQDLEAIAQQQHPSLAQLRSITNAARGQRTQAGLPYNPTLQYQSQEIGNEDSTGIHSLSYSQRIVTGGKLALAQSVESQKVSRAQALWSRQLLVVRTNVRVAFAMALIEQQRVELAKQIRNLAEQSVNTVQSLNEVGEVSRVALLQARVEFQQANLNAENAEIRLQGARRSLAAAVSLDELPHGILVGDASDDLTPQPWQSLVDELLANSPELAAAGSQLQQARQALCLAHAQNTPDITTQFGIGVDTATDDTFASIGVSVPLPIRNRNEGNIYAARARIAAANSAIGRIQYDLKRRLADAVARYRVARQQYERLEKTVLPLAKESLQLSLEAFQGGETSYLELLTAQRSLFSTRLDSLQAVAQARQAMAEINGQLVTIQ